MTPSDIVREEIERQPTPDWCGWTTQDLEQVALRCMERYREHLSEMVCSECGSEIEYGGGDPACMSCEESFPQSESRLEFEQREKEGRG